MSTWFRICYSIDCIMDYPIPNRARACSPSPTAQQQQDNNNNLSIRNISISMTRVAPQLYLPSKSKVFSRLSMSTATATSVLSKSSYWAAVDQNRHLIDIDNSSSPYHACVERLFVACPWHDDSDAPFQITIGIGMEMEPKTIIWIWVRNLSISQVWVEVEESNANGSITTFDAPLVQLSCYSLEQPTSSFGECLFVQLSCSRVAEGDRCRDDEYLWIKHY